MLRCSVWITHNSDLIFRIHFNQFQSISIIVMICDDLALAAIWWTTTSSVLQPPISAVPLNWSWCNFIFDSRSWNSLTDLVIWVGADIWTTISWMPSRRTRSISWRACGSCNWRSFVLIHLFILIEDSRDVFANLEISCGFIRDSFKKYQAIPYPFHQIYSNEID